jgi:hypothetical protein
MATQLERAEERALRILGSGPIDYANLAAQVMVHRRRGIASLEQRFNNLALEEIALASMVSVLRCDPSSFPVMLKMLTRPMFMTNVPQWTEAESRFFYLTTIIKLAGVFRAFDYLMSDARHRDLVMKTKGVIPKIILVKPGWEAVIDPEVYKSKDHRQISGLLQTELKQFVANHLDDPERDMEWVVDTVVFQLVQKRRAANGEPLSQIGGTILDVFSYAQFKQYTPEQRAAAVTLSPLF